MIEILHSSFSHLGSAKHAKFLEEKGWGWVRDRDEAELLCCEGWREKEAGGNTASLHQEVADQIMKVILLHMMVLNLPFKKLTYYLSTQREELGCHLVNFIIFLN